MKWLAILLLLTACDEGSNMPPCSALIVVGTVTFDCPGLRPATKP